MNMLKYRIAVFIHGILLFSVPVHAVPDASPLKGSVHLDVRDQFMGPFSIDDQATEQEQDAWLSARLRLGAQYSVSRNVELSVEGELRTDRLFGEGSEFGQIVGADTFDVRRDSQAPTIRLIPRNLSLRVLTPFGLFKCGHQAAHWGSGFLVNDGARERIFGDGWDGNLVERCLVAGKVGTGFTFFLGGDYVFHDNNANYLEGDRAYGWTVGLRYAFDATHADPSEKQIGLLFAQRFQTDRLDPRHPENEKTEVDVNTLDAHFKWTFSLADGASINWESEGAMIFGDTDRPYLEETYQDGASILAFGGMSRLDYRMSASSLAVEVGYASGDNDPQDDVVRQFTFNRAHTVGLILFAHVLPVTTAHSADRTMDPGLLAVPPSGTRFTVNQGAVRNAAYVYPHIEWFFLPEWGIRGAYLYAVGAADVVDTFQSATQGGYNTTLGGEQPGDRAYGQEIDIALVYQPTWGRLKARMAAEGGIFYPGAAFKGALSDSVSLARINLGLDW